MANFTGKPDDLYSRSMICDNAMKPGVDFKWTIERTSYGATLWSGVLSAQMRIRVQILKASISSGHSLDS